MGIAFLDSVPVKEGIDYLRLDRLPPRAKWPVIPTCHQPVFIMTHWMAGRTLPHLDNDCPGCEMERPKRFEAYMSVLRVPGGKHQIIALTLGAMHQIEETVPHGESIRGRQMIVGRRGERTNGQIEVEVLNKITPDALMPTVPDLYQHLIHIWGLDAAHLGQDRPDYAATIRAIATGRELPGQFHIRDGREAM